MRTVPAGLPAGAIPPADVDAGRTGAGDLGTLSGLRRPNPPAEPYAFSVGNVNTKPSLPGGGDSFGVDDALSAPAAGAGSPFSGGGFSLEAAEREFIRRALKETGWQRTRAAALLGITRATLHAKLKRYNIRPDDANLAHMASE